MFAALKDDTQPKTYKNLEAIKKMHEQQVEEMQNNFRNNRLKLENTLADLRFHNNQLEFDLRDVKSQFEKVKLMYEHKVQEEEYIRRDFEFKYKELESDRNNIVKLLEEELGNVITFK